MMDLNVVETMYFVIGAVCAFLLAYTLTPPVRVLAFKIGAIDVPADDRRMHTKPIPRIGGLAIFLAFTATTMLLCTPSRSLVTVWIGGAVLVLLMLIWDRIVVMGRLSAAHRKITALEKKLAVATDAQVRLEKERIEVETKLQQQLEDAEQRVNTALRAAGGQRVGFDSGE